MKKFVVEYSVCKLRDFTISIYLVKQVIRMLKRADQ